LILSASGKKRRDMLIELTLQHGWEISYVDEVW
jgi:hypothetical protein